MDEIRAELVRTALQWQEKFGVAPAITSAISEFDAATRLVGCSVEEYSSLMQDATAVRKGYDFSYKEKRYQDKANRPSGRKGSKVTRVANPKNHEWDLLIWILYDRQYEMQEAWQWEVKKFRKKFDSGERLSPDNMRGGKRLYPRTTLISSKSHRGLTVNS